MNLQEFIGGNPINRIDPDGRLVIFVHGIGETQHKDKAPLVLAGMQQSWAGAKLAKQAMIHFLYGPANAGDPAGQGSHRNMSAGFALKELVGNLQKFRTDNKCAEEPIYIYAYSNGAIVTYLALSFGMKVDGVVYAGAALQQNQPHRAMRSIMKNTPFLINYWSQSDTVAGLVGGVGSRGFADRSIEGLNVTQFQLPEIFHFKDDALVTAGSPVRVNGQSEWDSRFMGRIYGLDLRSASDSLSVQIHKFLGVAQNPDLYYQYESGVK